MKQKISVLLLIFSLALCCTACVSQKDYDALVAENQAQQEVIDKQQEMIDVLQSDISKMNEHLTSLAPYESIITNMQAENYDAVIVEAETKKTEKMKEEAGDIEDYLVTVELTSENINDYFELIDIPRMNSFGEQVGDSIFQGLRSLQYEKGYIIYKIDPITVEYYCDGITSAVEGKLESLLSFGGVGGNWHVQHTGRVVPGMVTYINKEYVESYEVPERTTLDQMNVRATIILKNGELISRSVCPEYPY